MGTQNPAMVSQHFSTQEPGHVGNDKPCEIRCPRRLDGPIAVSVRRWFLPAEPRQLRGQRWLNIGLRTLHLIGLSGLGAGFLYPGTDESWRFFFHLAVWSGLALSLLFIWSDGVWLLQLQGQVIVAKIVLLSVAFATPDLRMPLFVLVIVLSAVVSHAPSRIRHIKVFGGGPSDLSKRCER